MAFDIRNLLGSIGGMGEDELDINRISRYGDPMPVPESGIPVSQQQTHRSGGLRNILGTLADSLSVYGGGEPVYANRMRQKQMEAAIEGMSQDPEAGFASLAKLNPELALKWQNNILDRDLAREKVDLTREKNEIDRKDATLQRIAGMLRVGTPDSWEMLSERAKEYARLRGLDPEELGIPKTYTEGWAESFDRSLLDPKTALTQSETIRKNRASESARERTLARQDRQQRVSAAATAGRFRVQAADIRAKAASDRSKASERRLQNAEKITTRRQESLEKDMRKVSADVAKKYPGAKIQRSASTGRVRYSTDGGKTWKMAN